MTVYPSLQDSECGEPQHQAYCSQQVAPHVQCFIVDLEQTEDVTRPWQAHGAIPPNDEPLPEQRGDVHITDSRGKGGEEALHQWEDGKGH